RRVALRGQRLEFFRKIPVIASCAARNAPTDARVQVPRVAPPLFACVVLKEHFIEPLADLAEDDFLGVFWLRNRNPPFCQSLLHLFAAGRAANELLKGVEIDRELPVSAMGPGENLVLDEMPIGKLAQVLNDPV